MKRSYYVPEWWLWEVTVSRGEAIDYRSPKVNVVAQSAKAAADEGLAIVTEAWNESGLRALSVVALKPINGMSVPARDPGEGGR